MDESHGPAAEVIGLLDNLAPLTELPRTGWVLRGVTEPESIAAHTLGVVLVAMALVDDLRARGTDVDGERVLRMAALHDASEAATGDVPLPVKTPALREELARAESRIAHRLLPQRYAELYDEVAGAETLEARVVKAADKIQMMARLALYERQGRGELAEFWDNPKNENDQGLPMAREVFAEIRRRAGR